MSLALSGPSSGNIRALNDIQWTCVGKERSPLRIPRAVASSINKDSVDAQFTLFPKLPPEIRLRIYMYLLPKSRTITISALEIDDPAIYGRRLKEHKITREDYFTYDMYFGRRDGQVATIYQIPRCLSQPHKIPAVLQINREARRESLEVHKLRFHQQFENRPIYFDFERDTLLFKDSHALKAFVGGLASGVM
ncbi:hypothetical protein B0J14DRAFT_133975 [Halenospora varia]|nr:hypothetical protein B0J14DRAFT_133975 [Halenospora varia]